MESGLILRSNVTLILHPEVHRFVDASRPNSEWQITLTLKRAYKRLRLQRAYKQLLGWQFGLVYARSCAFGTHRLSGSHQTQEIASRDCTPGQP
jgi:hypothetical protein